MSPLRIRGQHILGRRRSTDSGEWYRGDNYNNIDPNEIENLTVLKDASATAIYGIRGANGVVLINKRACATTRT